MMINTGVKLVLITELYRTVSGKSVMVSYLWGNGFEYEFDVAQ